MKWLPIVVLLALSGCAVEPVFAADLLPSLDCKRIRSYVVWYGLETVINAARSQGASEETIHRQATRCGIRVPAKPEPWR